MVATGAGKGCVCQAMQLPIDTRVVSLQARQALDLLLLHTSPLCFVPLDVHSTRHSSTDSPRVSAIGREQPVHEHIILPPCHAPPPGKKHGKHASACTEAEPTAWCFRQVR
jgi:hypothetical protein